MKKLKIKSSYGNYEIILVNDGSTEHIDQIISLANNSDNIKILYQVNKGPSVARNYGISVAEGSGGSEIFNNADAETYLNWNWKAGTTSGIAAGSQTITPSSYSGFFYSAQLKTSDFPIIF